MDSPLSRFSNRVADYIRYRPGYPEELVEWIRAEGALPKGATVVDIGSGTGLLSRLFLDAGYRVVGVEPNADMRRAGDQWLAIYPAFSSRAAQAEKTNLPDDFADLVSAGQAFHWFEQAAARKEFQRILKPEGKVLLVWNERLDTDSDFSRGYEALLRRHCPEYAAVDHRRITPDVVRDFFAPGKVEFRSFSNRQQFDLDGIQGRLMSSSYAPAVGAPGHTAMIADLETLFDRTANNGYVTVEYKTQGYLGHFRTAPD